MVNQLIILLPLLGSIVIGLGGMMSPSFRKQENLIGLLATLAVGIPFVMILLAFLNFNPESTTFELFSWIEVAGIDIRFAYNLDSLGILMGLIVTGVGALIHIYSMGYMKGDEGYYRYFAYLNLFIFAMLNLILGSNMVVMFLGWEGVGLCSYLLIGFWYADMLKAKAAQKAFVVNRIGDFAMLIAMFWIFKSTGSLEFAEINAQGFSGQAVFWIPFLIFIAATGKSAQIPLFTWLPDAMAGPTPVSALIHAATMVTSGIYLIARMHPVFNPSPEVLVIIAIVAALTAIIAALTAIAQTDIKKVLAYSTVSQLGFMFMALGAGAYTVALFHVMTHAFFKACLFLGSGSVIHGMEHTNAVKDPQDICTMGGLQKHMPSTGWTFLISTLAISGIPLFAGFFSKDEILASTFAAAHGNGIYYLVFGIGILTAFLTAFYMMRLYVLTFKGKARFDDSHGPHESPATMTIPLWILAILASVGGFLGLPALINHGHSHALNNWLEGVIPHAEHSADLGLELGLMGLSIGIALAGVGIAWNFYKKHGPAGDDILDKKLGGLYDAMQSKFYFDEIYDAIIVRPFEWLAQKFVKPFDENIIDGAVMGIAGGIDAVGQIFRKMQTGLVQNYTLFIAAGVLAMLTWLIL